MAQATLIAIVLMLMAALRPVPTAAHPLGNFTINRYSRLTFADDAARLTYVLDFAEIPTFQQMKGLDTNGDGALDEAEADAYLAAQLPGWLANLRLTVADALLPLTVLDRTATFVQGTGGLPTLRVEAHLGATLPTNWREAGAATYSDHNYQDRLGWREVVVTGGDGVAIEGADAPTTDRSDELRSYPEDLLASPPTRVGATFRLAPTGVAPARDTAGRAARSAASGRVGNGGKATDRVAGLVSFERLTPTVILVSILGALFWGAVHALSPGHGKTVVAAYLVGARGTPKHAAFLGLTVTLTHTAGVFALGAITLSLSRYLLPEMLYPWLSVTSGLLVVAIGVTLAYQRLRALLRAGNEDGTGHAHQLADHAHDHAHAHDGLVHSHGGYSHSHLPPGVNGSRVTWRSLLALGVSGGLIPCPSALVLLLAAISLGRTQFGMVLVVAFSAGLALVLTAIGLALVYARRLFESFSFEARVPRLLPIASALVISLAGVAIVLNALAQLGLV